jgi:hypothetical protein
LSAEVCELMLKEVGLLMGLLEFLGYFLEGGSVDITFGEGSRELSGELSGFNLQTFVFLTLLRQDGSLRVQ